MTAPRSRGIAMSSRGILLEQSARGCHLEKIWKAVVWRQFGAAIDMLENALRACPEDLWSDRSRRPEFWYVVYHTLFYLDLYVSDSVEGFTPPAPFTLSELDPSGALPERPYTKEEMQGYLEHARSKCRAWIEGLTDDKAQQPCAFEWVGGSYGDLLFDNMRHVQHHVGQLNLILSEVTQAAPRWVARTDVSI